MDRLRFALTSEQLELLMAFENAEGLTHLAEVMARDPSVVSRNLQRLAEDAPVLKKVKGRWELTALGLQLNQRTRAYLQDQAALLTATSAFPREARTDSLKNAVLIIMNAQKALLDPTQERRNNFEAETNIALLLEHWRSKKRRVVHVKHVSENPASTYFRGSMSCDFLATLSPITGETVIEKTKASAFAGTNLEALLNNHTLSSEIVLTGFTANECIDTTARDAAALGFTTFVVGDGTATFDLREDSGKLVKADRIHKLTLLNLNAFHAKVISTQEALV